MLFSDSFEDVFNVLRTLNRHRSNAEGLGGLIGFIQQTDVIRNLPAPQHRCSRQTGHNLWQQFQPFAAHLGARMLIPDCRPDV
jgi:hypothetical protein